MRAKNVGNLAGVKIIPGEDDSRWYYLSEVSIRARPFQISRNRHQGLANDAKRQANKTLVK